MPGTGVTNISAKYAAALPYSHRIASLAEVWAGEVKQATLLVEASSSITVDRYSRVRRTCSVVLTDPYAGTPQAIVPSTAAGILTPYGNELVLYRGITYADGTNEMVQLGVFGLDDVSIDDGVTDLVLTLVGGDRGVAVAHAGFTDIYTIAPGTNISDAIKALISSRQTGLVIHYAFAATSAVTPTTPLVYKPGDDPWSMACDLAAAIGYELYFDAAGICTFLPIPDPKTAAVAWAYDEGSVNLAAHLRRRLSRTASPNYIIRDAQGSGVANGATTIASGSNGAGLPQATINVADTSKFPSTTGNLWVTTSAATPQAVSYTGVTATSFTGCAGGTGTMATKGQVTELNPRGVSSDTNPNSPTYIGGGYGLQVDYKSSSLYTTQAQAQAASAADLLLALGSVETMDVTAVPKPDHDVDDVVEVTRARTGVTGKKYVVDGYTLGFGTAGVLVLHTRQVPS